jgi:hydroxypyruvate reductase
MDAESTYRAHLEEIFTSAVDRVDPYGMIVSRLSLVNDTLRLSTEREVVELDLSRFERILLVGAGKASAPMARGVEEVLGDRLAGGIVVVKYGHGEALRRVELTEASHPVPDESGAEAGRRILELARHADERTLVLSVISGGGSSLLACPFSRSDISVSLDDLIRTNDVLLASGAPIQQMNCVRKHISAIKGGRLAEAVHPATSLNMILSDVVGDSLDSIASGPTVGDPTTYETSLDIVRRYGIRDQLPPPVMQLLEAGAKGSIEETPTPDATVFERCRNVLVGTNFAALSAAREAAHHLGYRTVVLTSQLTGEAREIAKVYAGIAKDQADRELLGSGPYCVIGGGETTVSLRGNGVGGRCQELALSFLIETSSHPAAASSYFLSASTDGNDGPTDAAGAFVLPAVRRAGGHLDPLDFLARNDSYTFFDRTDGLLRTGPTKTNVCDIQLLLVKKES